nr:MAG TPA_asm: hypothetical protein [Caudoviricetes sp.]
MEMTMVAENCTVGAWKSLLERMGRSVMVAMEPTRCVTI